MQIEDESWLRRLRAEGPDHDDALASLRALLVARLQRAFRQRPGVDDALLEDVAQEALLKTLGSLDQFQGRSRFTTWATTLAVRTAYTELRRRHWKDVSLESLLETPAGDALPSARPDAAAQQSDLVATLYHSIETELTEKQRTALLAELKGMPLEEIGRRMGSNRNAVYKLTYDARLRLKQVLLAAGYSAADLPSA